MSTAQTVTVTSSAGDDEPALRTAGPDAERSLEFLWREARALFLDQLPSPQRQREEELRDDTTLGDTVTALSQAKDKAEKAYGAKFKGKPVEIKLGRVLHRLEFILRFGDAAMKFAPETVSTVWAAFRLVASGVSQDFESCQFVVDAVDQLSDILLGCEVYAKRQLCHIPDVNKGSRLMADKVFEKIPPLLALVLRFGYETRRLVVEKGRFGRMFAVLFGGAQELKEIFKDAEVKRDELNQTAGIAFHEAVIELLQAAQHDTQTILKYLDGLELCKEELLVAFQRVEQQNEEVSGNVQEILMEQLRNKHLKETQALNAELKDELSWLQSEGAANLHEPAKVMRENLARRYPGTCEWIFNDERFLSWMGSRGTDSSKSILWISGEAGFGKSILMSSVMEHLERQAIQTRSDDRPVILRFFCKLGSDSTQKGAKVIAHLLSQLFHHAWLENASDTTATSKALQTKQRCLDSIKKLKEQTTQNDARLNLGNVSLFGDLTRAFERRVYVLVDALDECDDRSDKLLAFLGQIATASLDVAILVSSRPESDIHDAFANHSPLRIDIEKASTMNDVGAYIAGSLRTITRFDQSKRRRAAAHIAAKAAGMFRYANLAVESLKSPAALRQSFKQLMDHLPDGLTDLYEQELRALESAKREILMVALRWLVCGEGSISLTLVADELEGRYLDDDSDSEAGEEDMESDDRCNDNIEGVEDHMLRLAPRTEAEKPSLWDMPDESERDCIGPLRSAGRSFLKIDNHNIILLQHTSVRDYITWRSKDNSDNDCDALCPRCQDHFGHISTAQASPRRGHLDMALRCLKILNSRAFQTRFLPGFVLEEHKRKLHSRRDDHSKTDSDPDSDSLHALRYELTHWHYHVRLAEILWEKHERVTPEWLDLHAQIERFFSNTAAFQIWQKKVFYSRRFDQFDQPIHIASQYGILHYIQGYLESGGSLEEANENGNTPLHIACASEQGHRAVRLLVDNGADVKRPTSQGQRRGETALSYLILSRGPVELVQYLLDKGADATGTSLHGVTIFRTALRLQDVETVKTLLDHGGIDLISPTSADSTSLTFALRDLSPSEEIIRLLLERGASVHAGDPVSSPALIEALNWGNKAIIEMLLKAGADVNASSGSGSWTALHLAIIRGMVELVSLLLEHGASITLKDSDGSNAIWHAADKIRSVEPLSIVLDSLKHIPDGRLALNEPGRNGLTPLQVCVGHGSLEAARLLLDAGDGQAMVSQVDKKGNTALHLAAKRGHVEMVDLILKHGACLLAKSFAGYSAFDLALRGWSISPISWQGRFKPIVELLLDHGMPISESLAPAMLFLAAEYGSAEVCRRVIDFNDKLVQTKDSHGWTPLMIALQNRSHEVVRILLPLGESKDPKEPISNGRAGDGFGPSKWELMPEEFESGDNLELRKTILHRWTVDPVRANHPVPFGTSRFYWELEVAEALEISIKMGMASKHCSGCPAWRPEWPTRGIDGSWLYCNLDGKVSASPDRVFGPPLFLYRPKYNQGDTVGCGIDFVKGVMFFTKNGVLLSGAIEELPHCRMFPVIEVRGRTMSVRANFGTDPEKPFMYDPSQYGAETEEPTGSVEQAWES